MGCGVYWGQVGELERALSTMKKFGIPEGAEAYQELYSLRSKLLKQVGFKFPRVISPLLRLAALSPGSITLWHDVEGGWMTEARKRPRAHPVYHYVTDEVAMAILKGELTHELEAKLMIPDEYLGE